ncbi:hypothetical protein GPZ77_33410 [Streptomyces sp. QHH-9511]|uniref:DUF7224 domain-containing protein n=1 Tax=Streptomyces sp. QHH-9511 TaxID=2684468 RepID=UPI00131603B8|nr:hypothetical protein [Streptomyces sp. QHH-9511]QGZ52559.1 hypothetical protein GPZ77_33410 [Streptomyces sp. QHH-9511]
MITWANVRASAALWLVVPVLVYASLYIGDAAPPIASGYGVEAGELAAYAVAIIVPAVAGAAAWESGRHRMLGALRATAHRSAIGQLLRATTPVLIFLLVLVVGATAMASDAADTLPQGAGWLAVVHLTVLSCGWLVIGWCIGLLMPRSIAAPAVAIGCWVWLSWPHATANPWVRHLGGFVDGLSSVTDIRSTAVYFVPWGVTAGLALAFWALARIHRRILGVAVALAAITLTFFTGWIVVSDWGFHHPKSPRTTAMTCVGNAPRVCVPPEYTPYAERMRQDVLAPIGELQKAGVPAPLELRVSSPAIPLKPGVWPLYWSPVSSRTDPAQYAADIAESAVTGTAALSGVDDCRQPGSTAAAWAALKAGVPQEGVKAALPPTEWAAIEKLRNLPAKEQADWFAKTVTAQEHCKALP